MEDKYKELFKKFDAEFPDTRNVFGKDAFGLRRMAVKQFIRMYTNPKVERKKKIILKKKRV